MSLSIIQRFEYGIRSTQYNVLHILINCKRPGSQLLHIHTCSVIYLDFGRFIYTGSTSAARVVLQAPVFRRPVTDSRNGPTRVLQSIRLSTDILVQFMA